MKTKKINIFSIPIDALTMSDTLQYIDAAISEGRQIHHTVVNAGKIVLMQQDKQLFESVVGADLINADGQAVVWAANLLGKKLPERVAGIDLMEKLVERAHEKGYRIFLFGAKEEVVANVATTYRNKYSDNLIAGYRNGYFKDEDEKEIAKEIAQSGAQLLFVAITSPKKENFLFRNKSVLAKVNFVMGVGGSFDVIAGKTKRAPLWMQNIGLEWFYRFAQEPKRMWHRYTVGNLRFMILVAREWFRK